jgi:hypothetical protein
LQNGLFAVDSLIAYTSIVLLRYQFLIVEYRRQNDQRSFGVLFRACCDEMKDLTFYEALQRILEIVSNRLKSAGKYAEEIYNQIVFHIGSLGMLSVLLSFCRRCLPSVAAFIIHPITTSQLYRMRPPGLTHLNFIDIVKFVVFNVLAQRRQDAKERNFFSA